jgi:hypothetical protein
MKTGRIHNAMRFLAITAAAALVVGCASGGSSSLATKSSAQAVDQTYVARVESLARHRGVEVHWVNPPRVVDRTTAQR